MQAHCHQTNKSELFCKNQTFKNFNKILIICVFVCLCALEYRCLLWPEKDVEFSASGVAGTCDLLETSVRNQMWVLCKESMVPLTSGTSFQPLTLVIYNSDTVKRNAYISFK